MPEFSIVTTELVLDHMKKIGGSHLQDKSKTLALNLLDNQLSNSNPRIRALVSCSKFETLIMM
jgi:hypothetical protein